MQIQKVVVSQILTVLMILILIHGLLLDILGDVLYLFKLFINKTLFLSGRTS